MRSKLKSILLITALVVTASPAQAEESLWRDRKSTRLNSSH